MEGRQYSRPAEPTVASGTASQPFGCDPASGSWEANDSDGWSASSCSDDSDVEMDQSSLISGRFDTSSVPSSPVVPSLDNHDTDNGDSYDYPVLEDPTLLDSSSPSPRPRLTINTYSKPTGFKRNIHSPHGVQTPGVIYEDIAVRFVDDQDDLGTEDGGHE